MGDARSDNVLSDSEIRLLLETPTNEDGFELLKKIEKNTDTLFQFEKEVREIFPNAPKGKKKTKNLVQKFFSEYDGKRKNIVRALTKKEEIKPLKTLYKSESGVFKCLECDDESFQKEIDVVTHAKKHRLKLIATLAEENGQLIEYRTSPFIFNGLTSPRPLIMGKGKTKKEVVNEACTLKAENIILKERIKRLESQARTDDIDEDLDHSDEGDDTNKENSPALALSPGDTVFRIERNSSVTTSGKHATKLVANPNVPGGYVMSKAIIVDASSRAKESPARKTLLRNAEKINDLTTELSRGTPNSKNFVLGKVLDKQSPENIKEITSNSKNILEANKISVESGAYLAISDGLTQQQLRTMRRAGNNQSKRFLPSERKITEAKKSRLGVFLIDDYIVTEIPLQIRREGKDKKVLKMSPVLYVKNYKEYVKKVITEELPNITPAISEDGVSIIEIGFAADSGGGSMKFCMSIMNHNDKKVKLHVLLMYEAADTKLNNIQTFSQLTQQIKEVNDEILSIDGKMFKIVQKGVFDYAAQDDIVGKQNSSSTFPCTKCTVTLNHLQNHENKEHSIENCYSDGNIEKKSYKWYNDNLQEVVRAVASKQNNSPYDEPQTKNGGTTSAILQQSLEDRKGAAKRFGNVISVNLLELSSLECMVDPLLHILMGLCNDNLKFMRKEARELDQNKNQVETDQEKMDQLYGDINSKQELELEYIENSREMRNMIGRYNLIVNGKIEEAKKKADMTYKVKAKKKSKRDVCPAAHCLLFPVDIQHGYDRVIECERGCIPHTLCEGLHNFSEPILLADEDYVCNMCRKISSDGIIDLFKQAIASLDKKVAQVEVDVTSDLMEAKNLEQKIEDNMGENERIFVDGLKELRTEEQSYHGKIFLFSFYNIL